MNDNIITDLNVDTHDINQYHNYISNLSENNEEYKKIFNNISNQESQKTFIENDSLNTYNLKTFDKQIYNQLQEQQKNFKVENHSTSLVIYSLDRPWENKIHNNRNGYTVFFTENSSSIDISKRNIYENNPYIPFLCLPPSFEQVPVFNTSGFCWNGKYYPPYNPERKKENGQYLGLGKIIGEDRILIKYTPPSNLKCQQKFTNITKIEFIYALIPFLDEYIFKPVPDKSLIKDYRTNINSFPYIILNIDELNANQNNFGSNNFLDSSFAVLAASEQSYSRMIIGSRSFIKFNAIQGGIRKFDPAPLASLSTLTFRLFTPQGNLINFKKDNLKIMRYKVTNMIPEQYCNCKKSCYDYKRRIPYCKSCNGNIKCTHHQPNPGFHTIKSSEKAYNNLEAGELSSFPENQNGIIVLFMDKYFRPDEYIVGDKIQIKNFIPSIYPSNDYGFTSYCGSPYLVNRYFACLGIPGTYTWRIYNLDYTNIILKDLARDNNLPALEDDSIKTAVDLFSRYSPYLIPFGSVIKMTFSSKKNIVDITKIENYVTKPNDIPFFQDELLKFKEFMNRPEGHTIIWTDLYVKNPNLERSYYDTISTKKCSQKSNNTQHHSCNKCNDYWQLAEELYQPWEFYSDKKPTPDLNYIGNNGFQRNTIYIYGPIDNDLKKKKNIITFEKWFNTLISEPPLTNVFLPDEYINSVKKGCNIQKKYTKKESFIPRFLYPQYFYGVEDDICDRHIIPNYIIDRKGMLNNDSWTDLIKSSDFLNWMTYFPPIYTIPYNTFIYPNPSPLYSNIAWLILPSNPNAQLLSPQTLYLTYWSFTTDTKNTLILGDNWINSNSEISSSQNKPVCNTIDCKSQFGVSPSIKLPCSNKEWGYTIFNKNFVPDGSLNPFECGFDVDVCQYPSEPNYSNSVLLWDTTSSIDHINYGSIANISLQQTISLKIYYNQANTDILYKEIKGII